jgi:hypothetical protein
LLAPRVDIAGRDDTVSFSSLLADRTLSSCTGLLCAEPVSEAFWLRVALAQEQMTGRQAVHPLLGNKARIPLTQCDN